MKVMPVFKSPNQIKMANGNMSHNNGKLIIREMSFKANPFKSDLEECKTLSPEGGNPFEEEEEQENNKLSGDLLNSSFQVNSTKRRGTLERIVGLSPFKMSKVQKGVAKDIQQNGERRSFLGNMMMPLAKGDQYLKVPEKWKPRRSSEDFSILQMFNGKRKESLTNQDLSSQEWGNGADTMKRFLKLGRGCRLRRESMGDKVLLPESTEPITMPEEVKKIEKVKQPLSVLEIFSLIQNQQLETADEYIIELEAECDWGGNEEMEGNKYCSRKARDVVLLYEALMKELWDLVEESLTVKSIYTPLESLIQVIYQEEAADRKWVEGREGCTEPDASGRPREMKKKWAEAVKRSANKRLCQCLDGKGGSIPTQTEKLKRCVVEDLYTVKNYLVCVYPKEFQVFRVYMRSYHEAIASWLGQVILGELDIGDLYFVLDWNCNAYRREVLGRAEIASLVHAEELGSLLATETQLCVEEACISAVKEKITAGMTQALQAEWEKWAQETKAERAQETKAEEYQSVLTSKVISLLKVHVDRAPGITQGFGAKIGHCCLCALEDFVQSFRKKVEVFHKKQGENRLPTEVYIAKTIAIGNCCPPFREYAACLMQLDQAKSEEVGQRVTIDLDRVISLCNRVLTELIFVDLKPYFSKLMKRKWLSSPEAFENIVAILREYSEKLCRMSFQPYQALVWELHRQVLLEYVRPLLQAKMVCNSAKTRGKMAAKLKHEAQQLQDLFQQLRSDASWLNSVVPCIAEIILQEDIPSVQMEVGVLVTEFPDIRKGHLTAILDVRGTWNQAVRQDILAIIEDLESSSSHVQLSRDRAFFSEIAVTTEARCLHVNLNRASRLSLSCFSRLRSVGSGCTGIRSQQVNREGDQMESKV
ncbi:exocyst complex component 3-like protein 2 [Microcaecilia unicolor]|uniref:Exocyst complex component 3-like protein 2 n=1 Tax=Microcaecilia unicolor TaxID=1415580 RepID=A0A6P7ZIT4_9AMPH|nr:exocyst complex component 3-like protein 2 [Microcaecilia unicolor]XP_030075094.1 exocyst complex component 3-like protein 2 [Microcaecilia unicolor]XP_030075096.1 exocyst complex component 3-like protein 2 [Microcaecilia unicolor]